MPPNALTRLQQFVEPAPLKGEDAQASEVLTDGSALLFVADGHGGRDCAELAAAEFPRAFRTAFQSGNEPVDALAAAAESAAEQTRNADSGAVYTAVWVAAAHDRMAYAQLGDTAAVWRDAQGRLRRTPDHNVRSNRQEREAAEARGGRYRGGYMLGPDRLYGIQPARALGDREMGPVASKAPEIAADTLQARSWVVVSTDGILVPVQGDADAEERALASLIGALEHGSALDAALESVFGSRFIDDVTVLALAGPQASAQEQTTDDT